MQGYGLGINVFNVSLSISVYALCLYCGLWSFGFLPINNQMCAASGEDVADEYVHHHPAGVHCGFVGSEVYCGLPGIPLRPHHDSATAPPHPVQDL